MIYLDLVLTVYLFSLFVNVLVLYWVVTGFAKYRFVVGIDIIHFYKIALSFAFIPVINSFFLVMFCIWSIKYLFIKKG